MHKLSRLGLKVVGTFIVEWSNQEVQSPREEKPDILELSYFDLSLVFWPKAPLSAGGSGAGSAETTVASKALGRSWTSLRARTNGSVRASSAVLFRGFFCGRKCPWCMSGVLMLIMLLFCRWDWPPSWLLFGGRNDSTARLAVGNGAMLVLVKADHLHEIESEHP